MLKSTDDYGVPDARICKTSMTAEIGFVKEKRRNSLVRKIKDNDVDKELRKKFSECVIEGKDVGGGRDVDKLPPEQPSVCSHNVFNTLKVVQKCLPVTAKSPASVNATKPHKPMSSGSLVVTRARETFLPRPHETPATKITSPGAAAGNNSYGNSTKLNMQHGVFPGSHRHKGKRHTKIVNAVTMFDFVAYMDKRVMTKLNGGRVVEGTLRGFDPFMNLVVDDGVEVRKTGDRVRIGVVVIRGSSIIMLEALDRIS